MTSSAPKFLALKNNKSGPALGEAIARVSRAAGTSKPKPADQKELAKFIADPAGWLDGFAKIDTGTPAGKKIKGNLTVIPVFDTHEVMFVRVPVVSDLGNLSAPGPSESYATYKDFLANYFIKKCR